MPPILAVNSVSTRRPLSFPFVTPARNRRFQDPERLIGYYEIVGRVSLFNAAVVVAVAVTGCSLGESGSAHQKDSEAASTDPETVGSFRPTSTAPPNTSAGFSTSTSRATTTSPTSRAEYFASAAGTAERRCVDVDEARRVGQWKDVVAPDGSTSRQLALRSGEIIAGNLYELVGAGMRGSSDFVVKIWWVPLDPEIAHTTDLTVTVSSIDDPTADPSVTRFGYGSTTDGFFWPSGIPLPGYGRWRLTAEAGDHWGCFELSV